MYIAIKQDDTILIGVTISDGNVDMEKSDLALRDNMPIFDINDKTGFIVMSDTALPFEILRFDDEFTKVEFTPTGVVEYARKLKKYLGEFDILDDDGACVYGGLLMVCGGEAYEIDNLFQVSKLNEFCVDAGSFERVIVGSLKLSEGKPATERILEACRFLNRMTHFDPFPVCVYNSVTGKRKVYYK